MAAVKNFRYKSNDEIIEYAAHLVEQRYTRKRRKITDAILAGDLLRAKLAHLDHEVLAVLYLDAGNAVIAFEKMFRGTVKGTSVFPREIARAALKHNATAIILAHNHPGGSLDPSPKDWGITSRVCDVLDLIDVRVLDHIIVAGPICISLSVMAGESFPNPPKPRETCRRKAA